MSSETRNLRIVYMGTPEFAVPPLEALHSSSHEVVGVVTVADKPAGRGRKIRESAVKQCAVSHNIPVLQPIKLKDPAFLSELSSLQADLFVVVAFRMLPKEVWTMPTLGTFNLHGSLLPAYRGAAPIHWAVIRGEKKTGLTTFMLDEQIDTGQILLQKEYEIPQGATTGNVHDALLPIGAQLVVETVHGLASDTLKPTPQDHQRVSHAPKLHAENTQLNFDLEPHALVQLILGLNPFPGAHYGSFKFLKAETCLEQRPTEEPELESFNKSLRLNYAKGSIQITEIKPQGKRLMSGKDFINGIKDSNMKL